MHELIYAIMMPIEDTIRFYHYYKKQSIDAYFLERLDTEQSNMVLLSLQIWGTLVIKKQKNIFP